MRLFETLLVSTILLVGITQLLSSFKEWRSKDQKYIDSTKPQKTLLIISFAFFIVHFIFEGIRWQLYYLYAYLIFALIVTFLLKKTLLKNWKGLRTFIEFLNLFPLMISIFLAWVLPVPQLIEPVGEYKVGRIEKHLILEDRVNGEAFSILSDLEENTNRELMITFWYPTYEKNKDTSWFLLEDKTTPTRLVINYLNKNFGLTMPVNSLNHAKLTKVKASLDVNPAVNLGTPLVVYTHGWPAHRHFAADQLINLASHGYIVVSINHTGLSLFTEFPDGRRVDNIPGVQLDGKTSDLMFGMAEDIDSVVRYLKSDVVKENNLINELSKAIDFNDINIIGHSTGGGAGILYCSIYQSCSSYMGHDTYGGPTLDGKYPIDFDAPAVYIYSEDWFDSSGDESWPTEVDNYLNNFKNVNTYGYYISDTGHYDFLAFGSLSPLAGRTILKGPISYEDSYKIVDGLNLQLIRDKKITFDNYPYLNSFK